MKILKLALLLCFTLLPSSRAQEARFFRISGPVATTITAFHADGYITWTNAATNATFTVQTAQALLDQSSWVDYIQVPVTNPATRHRLYDPNPPAGMALIPAGLFTMGDTFSEGNYDELPLHTNFVSAFYMDKHEVTKALWDEVYQWATNHGYSFDHAGSGKAATHPVHTVNWYDCVKWCNARSEQENRVPAYYTEAEQTNVYRIGQTDVQNDWVKWEAGYRLPTEAEWEKAARGGAGGHRFPWADTNNIMHSLANYRANTYYSYDSSYPADYHPTFKVEPQPYTSPVGYFAPNGYGLYDMAGNVWEKCWDWWNDGYYSVSPASDPRGPTSSDGRVLRGGGWSGNASACRASLRYGGRGPSDSRWGVGFRSVLPPGQ